MKNKKENSEWNSDISKGESFPLINSFQKVIVPSSASRRRGHHWSVFWGRESNCFLYSLSVHPPIFRSIFTLNSETHDTPIHAPSWGSENANCIPYFSFLTSSTELSFFKSAQFNYHLSISFPDSKSFLLHVPSPFCHFLWLMPF